MMNRRRVLQGAGLGVAAVAAGRVGFAEGLAGQPSVANPVATTTAGMVVGYWAGAVRGKVMAFKGIPYGEDTRTTRFQPPKPVAAWTGARICTEWAPRAPQQNPDRPRPVVTNPTGAAMSAGFEAMEGVPLRYHLPEDEGPQSEDCLHVNVWTPGLRDGRKRPILFYVHGGAYNNGTVNAALYDGTRLVERGNVVVVTVNHRLNALGYMYLAGFKGLETKYAQSGNVGQLDLVLALQWVRANALEFGGDPERVTIFGQSGGGAKCATLMATPAAVGLFHRVLTMSGQQVWAIPQQKATANAKKALAAMGITDEVTPAKLEALTLEQIQAGARTTGNWLPVRDNIVLPRDPFDPDSPKISDTVPMILGNTKDEILATSAGRLKDLTWEALPEELGKQLQPFRGKYTVEEIIAAYRGWYPQYKPVDVYVASVAAFRSWPGQVIEAERRAESAVAARRTWVYQMDFGTPTADGRAPHTIDLAFVFDNVELSPGMVGASDKDVAAAQPLAAMMSSALIQFARSGNPNGPFAVSAGLPVWPVYGLKDRQTMMFDRTTKVESDPRGDERRMMVGANYRQPGT